MAHLKSGKNFLNEKNKPPTLKSIRHASTTNGNFNRRPKITVHNEPAPPCLTFKSAIKIPGSIPCSEYNEHIFPRVTVKSEKVRNLERQVSSRGEESRRDAVVTFDIREKHRRRACGRFRFRFEAEFLCHDHE